MAGAFTDLPFVHPLAPGVYHVRSPEKGRFPHCHSLLIDAAQAVLIDSGIGQERIRALDRVRRIDVLIISHSHPDHILAWTALADRHLLLPAETPDAAFDILALGTRFTGNPEDGAHWAQRIGGQHRIAALRPPDGRFGPGQILDFSPVQLRALRAPGHLADHYGFFIPGAEVLWTTDIDFTGFGPWYGNPEADIDVFAEDIRRFAAISARVTCSSHKPPVFGDAADAFRAYQRALARQRRQVWELCERPRTLEELVDLSPFYRHRFPDRRTQQGFERQLIGKNLALLLRDGKIAERGGRFVQVC
jgi:glyoxylase-like metal-dependent hydrolase (beta-lactamase superfamily II)